MPTIRPDSHELMCVEKDLWNLYTARKLTWGVTWAIKGWVQPCRALEYEDLLEGVFTGLKKGKS